MPTIAQHCLYKNPKLPNNLNFLGYLAVFLLLFMFFNIFAIVLFRGDRSVTGVDLPARREKPLLNGMKIDLIGV
jgi:hypothetical protein